MFIRAILAVLLFTAVARAGDFKVLQSSEVLQEGGRIETITIDTAKQRIKLAPPRDFILRVDETSRRLVLEGRGGQTAITVAFTTNSPVVLPKDEDLKSKVTKNYEGAVITSTGTCRTRPPGVYYELKKDVGAGTSVIINHAFIPSSEGVIELIFQTNGEAYKEDIGRFNIMIMTFRVEPRPPPK